MSVWETRGPDSIDGSYDENYFKKTEDITPTENGGAYTYSVTVKPNSIVTISTVTPERTEYKNADERERTVLKLPYSDDFEYAGYTEIIFHQGAMRQDTQQIRAVLSRWKRPTRAIC